MAVRLSLALMLLLMPILSLACTGKANTTPKDAREFAVLLVTKAGEGDWKTIRSLLLPEFQGYNEDALRRALNSGFSLSDTLWPSFRESNQWQEERSGAFTIVRVINQPLLALVLRQETGGEWRLDPGPYALALAEAYQQGRDPNELTPRNYRRQPQIHTNTTSVEVARRFTDELRNVDTKGDNVKVCWEVMLVRVSEAQLPLAGSSWRAGDKSGPARVVWTTGVITESTLVFPGAATEVGGSSTRYLVAFSLEGAPEAETVEFDIKDIVMDGISFSVRYSFEPNNP